MASQVISSPTAIPIICPHLYLLTASSLIRSVLVFFGVILQSTSGIYKSLKNGEIVAFIWAVQIVNRLLEIGNTVFLFHAIQQRIYIKCIIGFFAKIIFEIVTIIGVSFEQYFVGFDSKRNIGNFLVALFSMAYFWALIWELLCIWTFIILNLSGSLGPLRYSIIFGVKLKNLLYLQFLSALALLVSAVIHTVQRVLDEKSWHEMIQNPMFLFVQSLGIILAIAIGLILHDLYLGITNNCPDKIRRHFRAKIIIYIISGVKSSAHTYLDVLLLKEGLGIFEIFVQICQIIFAIFELVSLNTFLEQLKHSKQLEMQQSTKKFVKSVQINRSRLTIDNTRLLGEGLFGTVFKGTLSCRSYFRKTTISVAVKCLEYNVTQKELLISELKTLAIIGGGNVNVVKFYGIIFTKYCDAGTRANLVLEYCETGSLDLSLKNIHDSINKDNNFQEPVVKQQLTAWGSQIAKGMEFVSSRKIIHGDLAARNILLDLNLIAKISDFGMSRRLYTYQKYATSLNTVLPWRWMAPECFAELKFSLKSDIWSYGILLWEIFNLGIEPWAGIEWRSDFADILKLGRRLNKPVFASRTLYRKIMLHCWNLDPNRRISFSEIVKYFEHSRKTGTVMHVV